MTAIAGDVGSQAGPRRSPAAVRRVRRLIRASSWRWRCGWGYKQGEVVSLMIHLGDRLGIYRALAGSGPVTAEALAARTGLHPRWLLEWLCCQAAAGLVDSADGQVFEFTTSATPPTSTTRSGPDAPPPVLDKDLHAERAMVPPAVTRSRLQRGADPAGARAAVLGVYVADARNLVTKLLQPGVGRRADLQLEPPTADRRGAESMSETGRASPEQGQGRSVDPQVAWEQAQRGEAQILDLRTNTERRRYGAPPGAKAVALAKHVAMPEGPGTIYLCQHAVRSKWTLRRGAAEVAGGFVAWKNAGLPVEKVD